MRFLIAYVCIAALALFAIGFNGNGQAPQPVADTSTEVEDFGGSVRAYLLENPEVIIEAISILEQRREVAEAQADRNIVLAHADELFDDGYSYMAGNPDASVKIVEFLDYRCGYCRRAHPEVNAMLAGDDDLAVIYKEYPILGEQSVIASQFAIATRRLFGGQAYSNMMDALMGFSGNYSDAALKRLASGLDLDGDAILAEMQSEAVTAEIARNRALGNILSITGTPTFVVETEMLRGYVPLATFVQIVQEIREG